MKKPTIIPLFERHRNWSVQKSIEDEVNRADLLQWAYREPSKMPHIDIPKEYKPKKTLAAFIYSYLP